jgi:hypothetical protein
MGAPLAPIGHVSLADRLSASALACKGEYSASIMALQRHHSLTRGLGYWCTKQDAAALSRSHNRSITVTSHCLARELIARPLHRDHFCTVTAGQILTVCDLAGLPEEAIRSFERGIRMSPVGPRLHVTFEGIGLAFTELRRFEEAIVVPGCPNDIPTGNK